MIDFTATVTVKFLYVLMNFHICVMSSTSDQLKLCCISTHSNNILHDIHVEHFMKFKLLNDISVTVTIIHSLCLFLTTYFQIFRQTTAFYTLIDLIIKSKIKTLPKTVEKIFHFIILEESQKNKPNEFNCIDFGVQYRPTKVELLEKPFFRDMVHV